MQLQPACTSRASFSPRQQGQEGQRHGHGDDTGLADARASPRTRGCASASGDSVPGTRGPRHRCPWRGVVASLGRLAQQSQPPPANSTQPPQLFPIVQQEEPASAAPEAGTLRLRRRGGDQGPSARPAASPAAGHAPKSSAPTWDHSTLLHLGRGHSEAPAPWELVNYSACGVRGSQPASSPRPCSPPSSSSSSFSAINPFWG